jgi:hypothetical protein
LSLRCRSRRSEAWRSAVKAEPPDIAALYNAKDSEGGIARVKARRPSKGKFQEGF